MIKKTIFLKLYLSKLFKFLGIVTTLQLLFSFAFNIPYETFDFLVSFICGLLYMSTSTEDIYNEAVLLTKKYNGILYEKDELNKIDEKLNKKER
jgi:hypothetical protein